MSWIRFWRSILVFIRTPPFSRDISIFNWRWGSNHGPLTWEFDLLPLNHLGSTYHVVKLMVNKTRENANSKSMNATTDLISTHCVRLCFFFNFVYSIHVPNEKINMLVSKALEITRLDVIMHSLIIFFSNIGLLTNHWFVSLFSSKETKIVFLENGVFGQKFTKDFKLWCVLSKCRFYHSTFAALILDDWKQGQDKPLYQT